MATLNEELFRRAINSVFNSWTALQLAVEHGMGGPQGNAKALAMMDSIVELYRSKDSVDWQDVADLLSDLMDNEFNTICEDDSTDEVGCVIWELQRLCSLGDIAGVEAEISKLPSCKQWLKSCISQPVSNVPVPQAATDSDDSHNGDEQMETEEVDPDPGWTQVTRKKKGGGH